MRREAVVSAVPGFQKRAARIAVRRNATLAAAVSAALFGLPAAHADDDTGAALESIVVTAQKRAENLQEVPLSIQALGTEKIEELHINSLDDYVKYLPNVSFVRSQGQGGNGQPGTSHVYMRGVVSGGDGNHSGSLPSVGTYLDEQPVTTIDGALDVHMYDIERLEVLAGPQGTLYGASSEAGTIRIITNKPDPSKFSASYDVGVNSVKHGGIGSIAEGYVNFPITSHAAIRLVGWDEHDAGFIDNVAGTNAAGGIVNGVRTFPAWQASGGAGAAGPGTISNAADRKSSYNTVVTKGGRGALKLDLNDSWTVTPTFMAQSTKTNGFFGFDPTVGDLQVTHFGPEGSSDSFSQTALTIEGKVFDFDVTYAGAWMKRDAHSVADYSDYSFFYDSYYGSQYLGKNNNIIDPQQRVYGDNWYSKLSHEVRVSTPKKYPVKATIGAFAQRQVHDIYQRYSVTGFNGDGLKSSLSVPGWYQTIWLTDEQRVDEDKAIFAQATWDINPHWALTGGLRQFWSNNSLLGFYGMNSSAGIASVGTATCGPPGGIASPTYAPFHGAPCTNLNSGSEGAGHTPLLTLTYFSEDDRMLYATYSKGFRPGGANRALDTTTHTVLPPYAAEYLINFEFGWKTQWLNRRVRWNGAIFRENWNDFQFSFLAANSLTAIANAGQARIDGLESNLDWSVGGGLSLGANFTLLEGKLRQDYCKGDCASTDPAQHKILAPAGTRLPVSPEFKGDFLARYAFNLGSWKSNVQGTYVYQGSSTASLKVAQAQAAGTQVAFGTFDVSGGIERNGTSVGLLISNIFDKRGQLTRFAQCDPTTCLQNYIIPSQPLTIGIKFGQKF
jgi:outer membrane receptor protein involved in Fe transport